MSFYFFIFFIFACESLSIETSTGKLPLEESGMTDDLDIDESIMIENDEDNSRTGKCSGN